MHRDSYVLIHLCVLLWGFTAILGKLITLSAIPLVFWRVLIVSLCLFFWVPIWRQIVRMTRRDFGITVLNGVVITVHWLFFYGAIKAANASVAATCLALAPIFLSIIEPLWRKQAFVARDLMIAVIALPGVAMVVGGIPSGMMTGLFYGVMAALLAAVFSLISKGLAVRVPALCLTTIQLTTGTLLLGLLIPFWPLLGDGFILPQQQDLFWLVILAIACTLVPLTLTNVALRKISAFSVQLAVNLEPVYTILLAAILLGESAELDWTFYAGVSLILGAVLWHARLHRQSTGDSLQSRSRD
jgi:drug/metabolite transporter (DMT)-like permease